MPCRIKIDPRKPTADIAVSFEREWADLGIMQVRRQGIVGKGYLIAHDRIPPREVPIEDSGGGMKKDCQDFRVRAGD